jgi:hypothetical protein
LLGRTQTAAVAVEVLAATFEKELR